VPIVIASGVQIEWVTSTS